MRAATPSGGARLGISFEGAMPTMLVLKRLTVLAIAMVAIMAGAEAALAGLGQPSPWQVGLQQSESIADHAQHADRDRVDAHSDRDSDVYRGPFIQASVPPTQRPGRRPHGEGDRQAVVLELQLSRQRPVRVRFVDAQRG